MKQGIDYIGIAVTFFCHNGKGKFLMQKRSKNCPDNKESWQFGGGKIEFGETVEQAVLREVKEEYGCECVIEQSLEAKTTIGERNEKNSHWITLPHIVRVDDKVVRLNEPDKADAIGWFTLNDLPSPLHSGTKKFIEKYKQILKKYS